MRSYIFEFEQKLLVENKIKVSQVLILDYLSNFFSSGCAKSCWVDGKLFFWITYKKILDDLPILNLKTRQLRNLLDDLVKKQVIYKITKDKRKMFLRLNFIKLCGVDI